MIWSRMVTAGALALILGVSFYSVFQITPQEAEGSVLGPLPSDVVLQAGLYRPGLGRRQESPVTLQDDATEEDLVEAPRRVVAQLIRRALASPENQAAWSNLASSLEGIGGEGESESEGMMRAAQVADSVAASMGVTNPGERVTANAGPAWLDALAGALVKGEKRVGATLEQAFGPAAREAWFLPVILLVPLFGLLAIRGTKPESKRAELRRQKKGTLAETDTEDCGLGTLEAAQAMWSTGIPPSEIARKTGIAQDALAVMASLQRSPGS